MGSERWGASGCQFSALRCPRSCLGCQHAGLQRIQGDAPSTKLLSCRSTTSLALLDNGLGGKMLCFKQCNKHCMLQMKPDRCLTIGCCCNSQRGTLRVWRAANTSSAARFALDSYKDLPGHTGPVTSVALNDQCVHSPLDHLSGSSPALLCPHRLLNGALQPRVSSIKNVRSAG